MVKIKTVAELDIGYQRVKRLKWNDHGPFADVL